MELTAFSHHCLFLSSREVGTKWRCQSQSPLGLGGMSDKGSATLCLTCNVILAMATWDRLFRPVVPSRGGIPPSEEFHEARGGIPSLESRFSTESKQSSLSAFSRFIQST